MNRFLKIAFSFLLLIALMSGCKKDSTLNEDGNFHENTSGEFLVLDLENRTYSSSAVKRIFSAKNGEGTVSYREGLSLEAQIANQILFEIETHATFIEEFLDQYGDPYWEHDYSVSDLGVFNVSIPIIKEGEITGAFSFLQVSEDVVSFYHTSVNFNASLLSYDHSFTTAYMKSIFENLSIISGNPLSDEIDFRDNCCSELSVPTYATFSNNTWNFSLNSGSLCTCYDWFNNTVGSNSIINLSCCENGGTGEQVDGGLYEAGIDGTNGGSYNDWILYHTAWLEYWSEQIAGGGTVVTGGNNNNNVLISTILTDIRNEQLMLGWLTENFLEPNFGNPVPIEYINLFAPNPQVASEFYKYLQGFYKGVQVIEQNAIDLAELLVNNSPALELHSYEIQHILTFDPSLTANIETFLANHPNNSMAIQVVHDFLSLEYCPPSSTSCTDYTNDFNAILTLYTSLNQSQYDWLHSAEITTVLGGVIQTIHDAILDFFLTTTTIPEPERVQHIEMIIGLLMSQSSISISPFVLQDLLGTSYGLGLTEDEASWLINNDDDLTTILNIQDEYPEESLAYFVWVISQELMELSDLMDSYDEFNPDSFPEPGEGEVEEIQNGIEIVEAHPVDPEIGVTPGPQISHTEYRHLHDPPAIIAPDMDFGTDGNIDLLTPNRTIYTPHGLYEIQTIELGTTDLLNKSNDELFGKMEGLMDFFTEIGSEPKDLVLDVFIPRFRNSIGGDLENKKLNELVESTNEMKNFVKEFGVAINEKLKEQTGTIDFNNIPEFELPQLVRPRFSNGYTNYRANGLKIMINDTEQTNVYTQSFEFDQTTGEWTGVFLVEILDHFGLDDTDLVTFQELEIGIGEGFASWWILQHVRNHQPFRTKVQILYTLDGNIND